MAPVVQPCSSRLSEPRGRRCGPHGPAPAPTAAHPVLWSQNVLPAMLMPLPSPTTTESVAGVAVGQHEPPCSLGAARLERTGWLRWLSVSAFQPLPRPALPGPRCLHETAFHGSKCRQQFLVLRTVFHSFLTLLFPPLL